ncbi:hypothetical protein C6A86_027355 [Mycobacterium sp. ITM-2016-00316]|uniref:hypothetical protein n=1 Tax=Mycobacterium sp. ITM-2016-00316 TaxID=2099695 RepID=UPI001E3DDD75|nr:hypothetical protein [Mycobacterium sp. ITM-2016-00316]WNG81820.1 hypothetical protein C6A86_027355 [Mycobacterium sp. ITM-2016-00316]
MAYELSAIGLYLLIIVASDLATTKCKPLKSNTTLLKGALQGAVAARQPRTHAATLSSGEPKTNGRAVLRRFLDLDLLSQ